MTWPKLYLTNIPTIVAAPWRIDLPNGKALHGQKREIIAEALKRRITRVFNRPKKEWFRVDLTTGKITRA